MGWKKFINFRNLKIHSTLAPMNMTCLGQRTPVHICASDVHVEIVNDPELGVQNSGPDQRGKVKSAYLCTCNTFLRYLKRFWSTRYKVEEDFKNNFITHKKEIQQEWSLNDPLC